MNKTLKVTHIELAKVQYGWTTRIDITFKSDRQFTREHAAFSVNKDKWYSSLFNAIYLLYRASRSEKFLKELINYNND